MPLAFFVSTLALPAGVDSPEGAAIFAASSFLFQARFRALTACAIGLCVVITQHSDERDHDRADPIR